MRVRRQRVAPLTTFLTAALVCFLATAPDAKTLRVSTTPATPFTSIQAAINASADSDTVLVEPGTYFENIDYLGKDIVVISSSGPEATILDGRNAVRAVATFYNGEGHGAVLEGFTITGGTGTAVQGGQGDHLGGGVFIGEAEPTIRNNIIIGNGIPTAALPHTAWGGGIMCYNVENTPLVVVSPVITGNRIQDNHAFHNAGGIGLYGLVVPYVINNEISQNTTGLGDGGGLWCFITPPGGIIKQNSFVDNVTGDHGGAMYLTTFSYMPSQVLVEENFLVGNVAMGRAKTGDSGGGMWVSHTAAIIRRNTLVGNRGAGSGPPYGGGISLYDGGTPVIEQNIIAYSPEGGGILLGEGVNATIRNNVLWENFGGEAVGDRTDWLQENGNVVADPLFCHLGTDDYSVAESSPAFTSPAGVIGAVAAPGCTEVPVIPTTWGRVKAMYR